MSIDKQKNEGESLFQSNWHKCPNAIIDRISGSAISPSAVLVVLTVIRYTEGMSSRKVAAIPTATFKRVLGTKRDNTAYRYINEAIKSGLIHCSKKQGCVSSYSINGNCELWGKNTPLSESATTNEKRLLPLSESDSTPKPKSDRGPLSESATLIKKDINKDILKEENELEVFDRSYEVVKNQLKMAGIIPVGKPVNDDELKPEVYRFITWCNEKEIAELQRSRSVVKWFQRMDAEDRKRFYTFTHEDNRYYIDSVNEPEDVPVSDERAEEIRAQHADAIIGMGF